MICFGFWILNVVRKPALYTYLSVWRTSLGVWFECSNSHITILRSVENLVKRLLFALAAISGRKLVFAGLIDALHMHRTDHPCSHIETNTALKWNYGLRELLKLLDVVTRAPHEVTKSACVSHYHPFLSCIPKHCTAIRSSQRRSRCEIEYIQRSDC